MIKRVLDLGCGVGEHANQIQRKYPQAEVYGIDISPENIKKCEANRVSEKQVFKLCSAEEIPFEKEFFDEVHCFEVLEHVTDLDRTISEVKRVLKKGGNFVISVPFEQSELILAKYNPEYFSQIGHQRTFSKTSLIKSLEKSGFVVEKYWRCNAIEHFFWAFLFKNGWRIKNQIGELEKPPPVYLWTLLVLMHRDLWPYFFNKRGLAYRTGMLLFSPLWICGRIWDLFGLNKTQHAICRLD